MEAKLLFSYCFQILKAENADFNGLFGLIPFFKTDLVLDHSLNVAIKVKFVGSHDIKKLLLYCLI